MTSDVVLPTVKSHLRDLVRGIHYEFVAYRTLTKEEMKQVVGLHLGPAELKALKRGAKLTFITHHGMSE